MKNVMNNIATKAQDMEIKAKGLAFRGYGKLQQMKMKTAAVLSDQSGEGFVDTALVRHVSI